MSDDFSKAEELIITNLHLRNKFSFWFMDQNEF